MKTCVLIDDEPLARNILKEYIHACGGLKIVAECNNGFEGVKAIHEHRPELIFLDVQMPKINGFEMLELLENPPAVIFTTAFDEYAMKAFEAHALDYLLKPFSSERFETAFKKFISLSREDAIKSANVLNETTEKYKEEATRIVVRTNGKIEILPVQDVMYIEAFDDYVKIFTTKDMHLKKKTMSYFEKVLSAADFVRVHRSYIVSLAHITRIEPLEKEQYVAVLKNLKRIPLSKSGYSRIKDVLGI